MAHFGLVSFLGNCISAERFKKVRKGLFFVVEEVCQTLQTSLYARHRNSFLGQLYLNYMAYFTDMENFLYQSLQFCFFFAVVQLDISTHVGTILRQWSVKSEDGATRRLRCLNMRSAIRKTFQADNNPPHGPILAVHCPSRAIWCTSPGQWQLSAPSLNV